MDLDSKNYLNLANCFLKHNSFDPPGTNMCTHWISLGYPAFLVAIKTILGNNEFAIIFIQILLGILIILFTYKLANLFFTKTTAILSAFFASINIGLITYTQFILTEILLTLILLIAFYYFAAHYKKQKLLFLLASALLFGISCTIKASAFYYVFFLTILLLFVKNTMKKRLALPVLFLATFFIPVGTYMLRNKQSYGYFYLKSVDKVNLYTHLLPKLISKIESISFEKAKTKISAITNVKEYASGKGWGEANKLFRETVLKHPITILNIWLTNVIKTLFGLYTNHFKLLLDPSIKNNYNSFFNQNGSLISKVTSYLTFKTKSIFIIGLGIKEIIWNFLKLILCLFSLIILLVKRNFFICMLFASFIGYFAFITGPDGCARLRLLFEMQLIILSAFSFVIMLKKDKKYG
jgi:4-amino-4-deoxy-L-arabinose transferase-like glycosyltransferase